MPRQHLLFDPATNGTHALLLLMQQWPEHASLFDKTPDSHLIEVAPFLFRASAEWRATLAAMTPEPQACILIESLEETDALAAHLRQYILRTQGGRAVYFRCWDARVLDRWIDRWQPHQAEAFFGNAAAIETYSGNASEAGRRYVLKNGLVAHTIIPALSTAPRSQATPTQHTSSASQSTPQPTNDTPRKPRTFLV